MKHSQTGIARKLLFLMVGLLCAMGANAQSISVSGTVTDPSGEPLIGASVIAQGSGAGTATDIDGRYAITVPSNAVLVFSYVGYDTQNIPVDGRQTIDVRMTENSVMLNEVVAIGYGVVKKSDATGSVAVIKPDEIEAGLATSVQDMLVGQTPGVVVTTAGGPEGNATIRIRGGSSLSASNNPLIVIDGVPIESSASVGMTNPLALISPENIESMTVLKDASATAIYGSRASNGVIIVTTKKGKAGKPQVNFAANMYVNHARKTWDVLSANDFRSLIAKKYGEDSGAFKAMGDADTDWQDEVLRTTVSHDYNLSVAGTAAMLPYRVNVGYTGSNGILLDSKMDRVTAGLSLTPKFFNDHLSVNLNGNYTYIYNKRVEEGAMNAAMNFDPTHPVKDNRPITGGTAMDQHKYLYNGYFNWDNTNDKGETAVNDNATQNPVQMLKDRDWHAKLNRFNGNLQLDYAIHGFEDLHANINLGIDVQRGDEWNEVASNSIMAWRGHDHYAGSYMDRLHQERDNYLLDFYLNYKKEVESIHSNFDVTAGYSWQRFEDSGWKRGADSNSGYRTGVGYLTPTVNPDGGWNLNVNDKTENLVGKNFADDVINAEGNYHWKNRLQLLSFFGRVNYSLYERYLLTVTVRGDATSRFSKDNRWGVFPSVALGWKINDEAFLQPASGWLSDLKLRLGWGVTGQQEVGSTCNYLPLYSIAAPGSLYPDMLGGNGYQSTYFLIGYNPDLKWEQTVTWNAGLDFGFLNNRINGSIDYYYRKTKDLLSFVTVPAGSSTTNMLNRNIGDMKNYGVEFNISAKPVVTKDFTWTLTYNVGWNHNEITKLNDNAAIYKVGGISGGTGNTVQAHAVGYPAYSFYLLQQVYDADGKPIEGCYVDQNQDGKIDESDRVLNHSAAPKVTMTFGSQFRWKQWDLGFNLRASLGNYVYNNVLSTKAVYADLFGYGLNNLVVNDVYFNQAQLMSDYYLRNGSFLRCDNITLGYTFENLLRDRLRLRIFAGVQNPFVITKYKGLDPEVDGGIDNSVYPKAVTYSLGLVATF